jgi:hypothetical protein
MNFVSIPLLLLLLLLLLCISGLTSELLVLVEPGTPAGLHEFVFMLLPLLLLLLWMHRSDIRAAGACRARHASGPRQHTRGARCTADPGGTQSSKAAATIRRSYCC